MRFYGKNGRHCSQLKQDLLYKSKDQAQSTVNQAVDAAKTKHKVLLMQQKVVGQSAVNVAKDSVSDVVDTAKEACMMQKSQYSCR